MPLQGGRYAGFLYRAFNPVYARKPLSGRGAEIYGGRFNPKGTPALYSALDPTTALREANQAGDLQPVTLVSYRADLGPIFDARNTTTLKNYGMSEQTLAHPGWRSAMLNGQPVPTQSFAKTLYDSGYVGLLVRSFAPGTSDKSLNLILWRWSGTNNTLDVIDNENRLNRI